MTARTILLAAVSLLLVSCSASDMPSGDTGTRYEVRGVVARLVPEQGEPDHLELIHEAIPDFRNDKGEVTGMAPMLMPFTPAPGVDLGGISRGDRVAVTVTVDWDRTPVMLMTSIRRLDPATELELGGYSLE